MNIKFGFGKSFINLSIPDKNINDVLKPKIYKTELTSEKLIMESLLNPIGSKRIKDIVKKGEKICIITSDITRPLPSSTILSVLLEEIYQSGSIDEDITIVFALGNHRGHTEEEKINLVGEKIYSKITCVDSNQKQIVYLGTTTNGTPVEIFDIVSNADRVICLGNIEYHYFAGYSGGAKAVMPGVSTAHAIQKNHSMMIEENSMAGNFEGNNVRSDIDEVNRFVKIDFIVNVVLDEKKQIIKAFSGDCIKAHKEGCKFLDSLFKVEIERKADIVVVSPGGYPKDMNLYQAQKALDNSKYAVKDGGIIILIASCNEGYGEKVFESWLKEASDAESMVISIKKKFELGGHKAVAIGMVTQKVDVFFVSNMPVDSNLIKFFKCFDNAQEALYKALDIKGIGADIIAMPYGGVTLPILKK